MRPPQTIVRAKLAEIARRYAQRRKLRPSMASLRIKDLNRLLRGRYPNGITNDNAGRDFIVIMAHHLAALPHNPAHTITNFVAEHAPFMTFAETQELILNTMAAPKRWRADPLAWRLRLTDADRTTLRITTIGSIDVPKKARDARRKAKSKERSRKWREAQKRAQ